jgi:hypothetical protein
MHAGERMNVLQQIPVVSLRKGCQMKNENDAMTGKFASAAPKQGSIRVKAPKR